MVKAHMLRLAFAFSSVIPSTLAAQVPPELQEAMRARDRAELTPDPATWDRLTADDFTIVLADGTLMTKAERLAQLTTQRSAQVPIIYIDGQVVSEGLFALPEVPVLWPVPVLRHGEVQVKRYGTVFVRRFRDGNTWVFEIWVKDDGDWRVQAATLTRCR